MEKQEKQLFDNWPEMYDRWFTTPLGALVKKYETELIAELLKPGVGEKILDAGCGTGVFTVDLVTSGARVVGLDLSRPMIERALAKMGRVSFQAIVADMERLPFHDRSFDKVMSITALEFIEHGEGAVRELFRVTRKGGSVVVATLNRMSLWATRREKEARQGHSVFARAIFRSPEELDALAPVKGYLRTAIHFPKEADPQRVPDLEREGREKGWMTGAFVAVRWEKE